MRVTLVQSDIQWEDKAANLRHYEEVLSSLSGSTDLVVLSETCTTGFTMHPESLAETNQGLTLQAFQRMARTYGMAIAGTHVGTDATASGAVFNRAFFVHPDQRVECYDKRHLFRMGEEHAHYTAGTSPKTIVEYLGWRIRIAICYELRFPVWLRNVNNEYDLLLVMANWPEARQSVWNTLLAARALENQCYVCGVNRIGKDGSGVMHAGGSALINAYGKVLTDETLHVEIHPTLTLHLEELQRFRHKFPVWKDADRFELLP
jgi:predicted amidohydrolase